MNYKNAIYVGCNVELWIPVAEKLKKIHGINPVYFVGRRPEFSREKINEVFPDCFFQYTEDAWKGIGFPSESKLVSLDETMVKKIGLDVLTGMRMMDRLDVFSSFPSTDRQAWFIELIERWLFIIEKRAVDIIISPSIPHRVFDFALYVAAKLKGIKFIMFQMTHFGDGSFIIDDVNMTSLRMKLAFDNKVEAELKDLPTIVSDKLKQLLGDHSLALPADMVEQKNKSEKYKTISFQLASFYSDIKKIRNFFDISPTYRVYKDEHPNTSSMRKGTAFLIRKLGELKKINLKKSYATYCEEVDLNKKYVFLALHYQPEETSCPTGGLYVEQRQIIKNLIDSFPEYVSIYVKEHSSQFYPYFEGEVGRNELFYKEVSMMSDRVKFVSINSDTFELVDNSIAVATISGTVGWESLFRIKPVLLFGRGWYEDLPGVYKVKDKNALKLAVHEIIKKVYESDLTLNRLYGAHLILSQFLIFSSHYYDFKQLGMTKDSESVENIVSGIVDFLSAECE
ncbi:hypothetical protein CBF23_010630 [Marinomonas agarivorans]|nr:hypothetical protein CBF23_010630 [Marinomonas agarivorans]